MRTAIVVGAGVAGLATAGGLARAGWSVTVLERSDRLRGHGGAAMLWPNGLAALDALGIGLECLPIASGGIRRSDGRLLAPADRPGMVESYLVPADELHEALVAGLGETTGIRLGAEVTSLRTAAAVTSPRTAEAAASLRSAESTSARSLASAQPAVSVGSETLEADLIVLADGAQSRLRQRLVAGSSLTSAGYSTWQAALPWFRGSVLDASVPASADLLGDGQRFFYATLGERASSASAIRGGVCWFATVAGAGRPEAAVTQLALLQRWFAGWPEPVGTLLATTNPDELEQLPAQRLSPPLTRLALPVGSGGFVLVGDAAHVTAPDLAFGAGLALEDAVCLASLVRDSVPGRTLGLALPEYTRERLARLASVERASDRLAMLLQARGGLRGRVRDLALQRFPARVFDQVLTAAVSWRPQ